MTGALARGAWQLDALEAASGMPRGAHADVPALRRDRSAPSPRAAFEGVVRDALERGPCVVSFSGGRDSSTVLAVAASVAAREGLPPPVAVTLRFPGIPESDESAWQQDVVQRVAAVPHAGTARPGGTVHWEVLDVTDELDLLGPAATRLARAHGVLWPANTHFHAPVAALAAGGTVLTGFGGDEVVTPGARWDRLLWVLDRRVRPRRSDLGRLASALSPPPVRRAAWSRHGDPAPPRPWLRPSAAAELRARTLAAESRTPVRYERRLLADWWRSRYRAVAEESLGLLADDAGARCVHPFTHPDVLRALGRAYGTAPPTSRTAALRALVGDLLPDAVLTRTSKSEFGRAFWGPATEAFVRGWDGSGLDPDVVDTEVLRRAWLDGARDGRSFTALQQAWAAGQVAG